MCLQILCVHVVVVLLFILASCCCYLPMMGHRLVADGSVGSGSSGTAFFYCLVGEFIMVQVCGGIFHLESVFGLGLKEF